MNTLAKCFSELIAAIIAFLIIIVYVFFYIAMFLLVVGFVILAIPFGLVATIVIIVIDYFDESKKT